jgi:hypothetical protein
MLISAFNLFYLLETQEIFMQIARRKWSVHDTSRILRVQIESSHPGLWTFLGVPRIFSNRQLPSYPISLRLLVQRRASDDPALKRISDSQLFFLIV